MASAPVTDRAGPKGRAGTRAATGPTGTAATATTATTGPATATARPARFYRPDRYSADESVGYLMRRVLNGMAQATELRLEPHGLTNAQWMPLFKLRLGAAQTVAELARECQADAGAMTRMLDRLEAKGLCRRVRSTADRRVVNIELTPDGEQAADKVPPAIAEVLNGYLAGFTREEWEVLKSLLRRMLGNADAARELR
ncbi:MAG: MarR family transcriptional regulator [Betaproteobacteria bacterium]|nr:MarR family transcriptional regulator [Betaproteobacteria bacterium]